MRIPQRKLCARFWHATMLTFSQVRRPNFDAASMGDGACHSIAPTVHGDTASEMLRLLPVSEPDLKQACSPFTPLV